MSKDLPDLPSDEELGIDDEDLEKFLNIDPEKMSDEELAALLQKEEGGDASKKKKGKGVGARLAGMVGGLFSRKRKEKQNAKPGEKAKRSGGEAGGPAPSKPAAPAAVKEPPAEGPPGIAPPAEPPDEPPKKRPRPARDEGPRSRWLGPVTLTALIVISVLVSTPLSLPSPVPANAPDTEFSSSRAMTDVVAIARTAHPPGSPEHARVRQFIVERLELLGLEPEVQTSTFIRQGGGAVRAATVRNVVARIPGTASTGAIVLTAHYDAAGLARGAGDDGTGVVTILETVRALQAGPPLQNDVIVLITDAEELGLMGARTFVNEHPWMDDVTLVISVEMRGGGGPSIMFETGAENGWIIRALQEGDPRPFANSLSQELYRRLPNDTDFTPFLEEGVQGLNFAAIGRAHVYHQTYDDPSHLSERTLQHHGLHVLGMTRHLGNRDLATVEASDRTYFRLPFLGLMAYGGVWVLPVTALLLLVAGGVLWVGIRRGARIPGLLVGLGVGIVSAGVTGLVGSLAFDWLTGIHPEYGALMGSAFHSEGWYVLGLAAVAFVVTTGLFGLARTRFTATELAWGGLLLPVVGAVVLSVAMPLAAMNLQWPAMLALVAVLFLGFPRGRLRLLWWVVILALAAGVLAMTVPLTELVWQALSLAAAPYIGVLLVLTMLLLLPALEYLREPTAWWAPLVGLVLVVAFTGVGIALASPSPSRPQPTTLAYVLDRQSQEAMWITDVLEGPLADRARGWAEVRTGVSFEASDAAEPFGYGWPVAVAPAPVAAVPPLDLSVVSDTVVEGTRRVRVAVRSQVGAEMLVVKLGQEDEGPRLLGVNGRELTQFATYLTHWGEPEGGALLLDLDLPMEDQLAFEVLEHHLRPGDLPGLGSVPFMREPHLAPNVRRLSDRAVLRTVVGAQAEAPADSVVAGPGTGAVPDTLTPPDTGSAADTLPPPDTGSTCPDAGTPYIPVVISSQAHVRDSRAPGRPKGP